MSNDLAQMVKDIALSHAQATMGGYDAGREQGFREGIKAAADLLDRAAEDVTTYGMEAGIRALSAGIRSLRP